MPRTTLLVLIGSAIALTGCARQSPEWPAEPAVTTQAVETATVQRSIIPVLYESTGSIKAQFNATLSSKIMARVTAVLAREGDSVRKGQTLIALDSRELAAGVGIARANLTASQVGLDSARTSYEMEAKTNQARISQNEAAVAQSRAALNAAKSRLDLVLAGPRTQEKVQAHLAVVQAESALKLAKSQFERASRLVAEGAMARKSLEEAQTAYDVALAQRDTAIQAERIAQEGSRTEEIRAAQEGVAQAKAAVQQAEANLRFARASALETKVRFEQIRSANAQVRQSSAALQSAEVSLGYATIAAPFDGRVVSRSADPGTMALPGSSILALEGGALRLEALVPEIVLPHVRRGATVRVKVDAIQRELEGIVSEIVPQGDAASHTFVVKLDLGKVEGIRSAMFGRAFFVNGKRQAIQVPAAATWEREGLHYIFVVNPEGVARLRVITLGESTGERVTVLSGLSPGETIVVKGRESVLDGIKVASR